MREAQPEYYFASTGVDARMGIDCCARRAAGVARREVPVSWKARLDEFFVHVRTLSRR